MELIPLKSTLIKPGDNILEAIDSALTRGKHRLRNGDILAIASKAISLAEGRIKDLSSVNPSPRAIQMSGKYSLSPQFAQIVINEADQIIGGVKGAVLTIKNGEAAANAGADQKNAPKGSAVLWPLDPDRSAERIRREIVKRHIKRIGVVIVDSRVTPLRLGTVGLALGTAGFQAISDFRGTPDLHGRRVRITVHSIRDDVASAAHLLMGEGRGRIPFVLVRGSLIRSPKRPRPMILNPEDCLFFSQISSIRPARQASDTCRSTI